MLKGWLDHFKDPTTFYIVDPNVHDVAGHATHQVHFFKNSENLPREKMDAIILAVKPQLFHSHALNLKNYAGSSTVVVSIMAGVEIAEIAAGFEEKTAVVRSMPNLPASIGQGMTVVCANDRVAKDQKALTTQLLEAIGKVEWIGEESLMHAVTAISGSGPAYLFHLAEAMEQAAGDLGLSKEVAIALTQQTLLGSAALLAGSDRSAADLRQRVTSPGGTTEAALEVLQAQDQFINLVKQAIEAAQKRSEDLAQTG